ncbi:DUF350 domain-containing protein [Roseateles sp. BYS180W]|uniref:DUF350 domain-containing protein n=1 Tax=Roseateles rivi TaxID=3299028 RepID=A0ABW7FSQ2_9BURK
MSGFEWLKPAVVLGSVLYAVIGVVVLWVSFVVIDKLTPYKLWEQIVEHKNLALGVVVAGMFVAIGQIVAAAIHG